MVASILIEEESGTYRRSIHPHNGYYAGDFLAPNPSRATTESLSVPAPCLTLAPSVDGAALPASLDSGHPRKLVGKRSALYSASPPRR